ncbi:hypothetical protein [Candidatus Uabimicrobium amorphum]|uniref:Uncharacterized protein n=1 Tax=Uabimicrobium amorphum TaxID=2596890 RepID=A0A5S9F553_UABAM|nr:hypothetical protein [Candidatus Uabimicrobium amorphum]BBM85803.1 hypothetical protein UABAM_04181 [Candidatus Uabimicrobium amorphum]
MKKTITLLFALLFSLTYADENSQQVAYVGTLVKNVPLGMKNPSEYCLEDGYIYKGAAYRIAGMNIHSDQQQDLSPLAGKVVIIYGKVVKDLNKILVKGEKAPEDYGREQSMMQIRSDWVTEETGFSIGRSSKEKLKEFSFIHYSKVEEFTGLQVEENDTTVSVTFRNMFDRDIKDLQITAHYEVVFGKPQPRYTTNQVNYLYKGQSVTLTFPMTFNTQRFKHSKRKRSAKYRDINISAHNDNLRIHITK